MLGLSNPSLQYLSFDVSHDDIGAFSEIKQLGRMRKKDVKTSETCRQDSNLAGHSCKGRYPGYKAGPPLKQMAAIAKTPVPSQSSQQVAGKESETLC